MNDLNWLINCAIVRTRPNQFKVRLNFLTAYFTLTYYVAELETIKHNYEEQLNTMTEELAQQLNQSGLNNSSNVMGGEDKTAGNTTTAKKSRFSLFGRGSS